jgi:hypothetical protein
VEGSGLTTAAILPCIKLYYTYPGQTKRQLVDKLRLVVVKTDIDVDSDNNDVYLSTLTPQRSLKEERIEEKTAKVVMVNLNFDKTSGVEDSSDSVVGGNNDYNYDMSNISLEINPMITEAGSPFVDILLEVEDNSSIKIFRPTNPECLEFISSDPNAERQTYSCVLDRTWFVDGCLKLKVEGVKKSEQFNVKLSIVKKGKLVSSPIKDQVLLQVSDVLITGINKARDPADPCDKKFSSCHVRQHKDSDIFKIIPYNTISYIDLKYPG